MRITNRAVSVIILAVAPIYLALSFNLDSYPYAVIDADVFAEKFRHIASHIRHISVF
nr:hypothetical protein [Bacillus licheniformis]